MTNLRLESVLISSLSLDPTNARRHDSKNLASIEGSLRLFGQRKPIVVTGANVVVAGNGTLEAAKSLGWSEIDVVRIPNDWSAEQVKAYALADNRTAELAEWDAKVLADQLVELDAVGWDVAEFGFDALEPPVDLTDDEPLSFDEVETRCKKGDVWFLGKHKLICGDSLDLTVMDKLMEKDKVDIVWTDPPYGISVNKVASIEEAKILKKRTDGLIVENDDISVDDLEIFLRLVFNNIYQATKPGACWYVAAPPGTPFLAFAKPLLELKVWKHTLVWVKDVFVFGRSDYHYRHESIFYGWTPGAAHQELSDRKQDTVWEIPRPRVNREHPTMKPIQLIAKALKNSANINEIVLDPFGGSGSTLIAAEQLKMKARIIEIDPKYCDVIIDRWERLTGLTATRLEQ